MEKFTIRVFDQEEQTGYYSGVFLSRKDAALWAYYNGLTSQNSEIVRELGEDE